MEGESWGIAATRALNRRGLAEPARAYKGCSGREQDCASRVFEARALFGSALDRRTKPTPAGAESRARG